MDTKKIKRIIARGELIMLPILTLLFVIRFPSSFLLCILLYWFSFNSGYIFYDSRKRYPSLIWNIGLAMICGFPILFFVYLWLRPQVVFELPEINLRWKILFGLNIWIVAVILLIIMLNPFNHFF